MARKKKKKNNNNKVFMVLGVIILIVLGFIIYQKVPRTSNEEETNLNVSHKQDNVGKIGEKRPSKNQKPVSQESKKANEKKKIPQIPVKETDDQIGELRIEGQVIAVDEKSKTIKIEQIMDDNSTKVNPLIKISDKAVIQNNDGKIKLSDISVGAVVDIIISNKRIARSVTVIE